MEIKFKTSSAVPSGISTIFFFTIRPGVYSEMHPEILLGLRFVPELSRGFMHKFLLGFLQDPPPGFLKKLLSRMPLDHFGIPLEIYSGNLQDISIKFLQEFIIY